MIVKKMPILQGFPAFERVKKSSVLDDQKEQFSPVFYDIETTGLARNSTYLYLIGAVVFENQTWELVQFFACSLQEEPLLLKKFAELLHRASHTIQYNGCHFDQPYLEAKYRQYELPSPFLGKSSLDLYLKLKPLKSLLKLSDMKQPSAEQFLGMPERSFADGRECIRLFRKYLKTPCEESAEILLGHNREDMLGLGRIFTMLPYLAILNGNYEITDCSFEEERLLMILELPEALPVQFSNGTEAFYITGEKSKVRLMIKAADGRLRRYYSNYKDYVYLPLEDTALPKILAESMDKKLQIKATPQNCYTWFTYNETFAQNPRLQKEYLIHALPILLSSLP